MNTIELKYELFKEIDSINDSNLLHKIAAYIRAHVNTKPKLYDAETGLYVNETTMKAIEESMNGECAGKADLSSLEAFEKSLGL